MTNNFDPVFSWVCEGYVTRGATTFSKLRVQFLGLGYCTEQTTDGIPSFVHCSLQLRKKLGWYFQIWGIWTPRPPSGCAVVHDYLCVCQVSGARFWKLLRQVCVTPENFFRRCFVHNMCPLLFMCLSGKNVTPPELPASARQQLNAACDRAVVDVLRLLCVRTVVAIGKYTETRVRSSLDDAGITDINIATIMHPSPANPAANRAWNDVALAQLTQAGLLKYLQ